MYNKTEDYVKWDSYLVNNVHLVGEVTENPSLRYEKKSKLIFSTILKIERKSGSFDLIPLSISEEFKNIKKGMIIEILGGIYSYDTRDENRKRHLNVYVEVKNLKVLKEDSLHENEVFLVGYICKEPVLKQLRDNYMEKTILAMPGKNNKRSSYIPIFAWNNKAFIIKSLKVPDKVILKGQIQSRIFNIATNPQTTYEIVVNEIRKQ